MNIKWDNHFLNLALEHARMSKDPSTRVGAIIVGPDREIRSAGFNGFPRLIKDSTERLSDRETKIKLTVHAEMNAALAACRIGVSIKGCILYVVATNVLESSFWGGPPCTRCAVELMQAGITQIVSWPRKSVPSRWKEDLDFSQELLHEARIIYREVPLYK